MEILHSFYDELKLHKEWLEKRRERLAEIIKNKENKEKEE